MDFSFSATCGVMTYLQPPDTGGRNATSSPSETGCDILENVALTAHDSACSNGTSAGAASVADRHTIATVAGSGTSTVIVSVPASSFRRANKRTVTRMQSPARAPAPPHHSDRRSPIAD